jgi:protocatechuate 3,4-dioxygenase beta subunit
MTSRLAIGFLFLAAGFGLPVPPASAGDGAAVPVAGWVLAAAGRTPVAGTEVTLRRWPSSFREGILDLGLPPDPPGGAGAGDVPAVDRAHTDGLGRFRLEAPAAGAYRVTVEAPGAVAMEYELLPLLSATRLPPLEIRSAEELDVWVTDGDGRAVAGSRVRIGAVARDPMWQKAVSVGWRPRARPAVTDGNGQARLLRAAGEAVWAQAWASGYLESEMGKLAGGASASGALTLTLAAGEPTAVEVIDSWRRPAAGLLVRVGDRGWPRGLTDEQGRIRLAVPPEAPFTVTLENDAGWRQRLAVNAGEPARLDSPQRLAGRVTDATSGRPLAGAFVWERSAPFSMVRAAADGTFELPFAGPGIRRLHAAAPGHLARAVEGTAAASSPVIALQRAANVGGRVRDEAGRPLERVRIELVAPGAPPGSSPPAVAFSGADGRFEIPGVAPAETFELAAAHEGFAHARLRIPATEAAGLDIVLSPAGVDLEGTVEDADGRLLQGARVELTWSADADGERGETKATTTVDGSFSFTGLTPGERVDLRVEAPGYASAVSQGVEIPAAGEVRLVLERAAPLWGRVMDEEGASVADARLELRPEAGGYLDAATDETGSFRFDGAPPGPALLLTTADGFVRSRLAGLVLEAGTASELEVVLRRGAVVEGRVLAPGGMPVPEARVRSVAEGAGGAVPEVRSDAQGRYRLSGLAPGPWFLEARHDDYPPAVRQVQVAEGDNRVDLRFQAGAEVAGRVTDSEGAPLTGVRLVLQGTGAVQRRESSVAAGEFRFAAVADGSYRLHGEKPGWASAVLQETVEVAGRDVDGLELTLTPGGRISGQILGLDPGELGRVEVSASDAVERIETGETDPDGRFRVGPVEPGEWWVVAALPDGRQERTRVELDPGQREAVADLDFSDGTEVAGRVLVDGLPRPNLTVTLHPPGGLALPSVLTDRGGRFRVSGLAPGRHRLAVEDFRRGLSHREELAVPTAEDVLVAIDTAQVSGRVLSGADRGPLVRASASLAPAAEEGLVSAVETDDEGSFRFESVTEGHWRLQVRGRGHAAAELPFSVGPGERLTGLEVVLEPAAGLTLEVRLASGRPPPRVHAALVDGSDRPVAAGAYLVGEAGEVSLTEAPPGRWRLLLSAPGTGTAELPVDVPGRLPPVILPPAGSLEVRVAELAGSPEEAVLTLLDDSGRPLRLLQETGRIESTRRFSYGHTVLDGIPAGIWSLRVVGPAGREWVATLPVEAGRRASAVPSAE